MVRKVFYIDGDFVLCKVGGHKEAVLDFDTEEDAQSFIEKVKNNDEDAIDELEDNADILIDNYSIAESYYYDGWKVEENG